MVILGYISVLIVKNEVGSGSTKYVRKLGYIARVYILTKIGGWKGIEINHFN